MSLASNLAALGRVLTAAAGGIVKAIAPAAGDSSTALITSAWFKGEQAAEATQGTAKVATQAQTNAGTDDATIVTPKKLRAGFAISLGTSGYIAFPTWLGGLIIQWATIGSIGAQGSVQVTLPIAFPNLGFVAFANSLDGGFTATYRVNPTNPSKTALSVGNTYTVAIPGAMVLVLGY